ncbi:hypothetical protein T459_04517 [Capsicum annuum]|uniref:Uncharacterized protein n=1 Tax=Capsicum annuum TaxID=4072 RepID=A0A2G3A5A3_CAPAN|nr:hypothetical protein T459_04517 [Capsicum annuum]
MSGPLLTYLAAGGSAFAGHSHYGSWAAMLGIIGGALASVLNTIEHGGQVGMDDLSLLEMCLNLQELSDSTSSYRVDLRAELR